MTRKDYEELCALLREAETKAQDFWTSRNGVTSTEMLDAQSAIRERIMSMVEWGKS